MPEIALVIHMAWMVSDCLDVQMTDMSQMPLIWKWLNGLDDLVCEKNLPGWDGLGGSDGWDDQDELSGSDDPGAQLAYLKGAWMAHQV